MDDLVWQLIRRSWRTLLSAAFLGAGAAASSTAIVALINSLLVEPSAALVPQLLVLGLISAGLSLATHVVLVRRGGELASELRRNLIRQVIAAPLRQIETVGSSPLFSILSSDVAAIVRVFSALGALIPSMLTSLALVAYITTLSWKLLVATIVTLVLLNVLDGRYRAFSHRYFDRLRVALDPMIEGLHIVVGGVKELKLNRTRAEAVLAQDVDPAIEQVKIAEATTATLEHFTGPMHQFVLLMWIAGALVVGPSFGVSMPALAAYALTLLTLSTHIHRAVNLRVQMMMGEIAVARARQFGATLLGSPEGVERPAALPPLRTTWKELNLLEVTHSYRSERDDATFTLGPINLSVKRGDIVFIIGGNGSGKSTLAKLITGLYVPEAGEIWFGGEPIDGASMEWYRNHFSAIFTDFMVFDSLAGLAVDGALDERATEYLKLLQIDHKVTIKNGRFSTTHLSTGQKKRLALLASYLEDRPIYVFDEWAADQDPAFKAVFYKQLLPDLKSKGKTVLVISHDERYFELADQIVKLQNGGLAGDSTAAFIQKLTAVGGA